MEFRNLTPFDALCFSSMAPDGEEHPVVAVKVVYRLLPDPDTNGRLLPAILDDEAVPLCLADEFYGEAGESSTREESDLSPYKPRCDVLVRGHAHAPGGKPAKGWQCRLRVSRRLSPGAPPAIPRPYGLAPNTHPSPARLQAWQQEVRRAEAEYAALPTHEILLDKALLISGAHRFRRGRLRRWQLADTEEAARVPLRWELAWGGRSCLENPAASHDADQPCYLLDEVCYSNPLGLGWFEQRQFELAPGKGPNTPDGYKAPQIDHPGAPASKPVVIRHPDGPVDAAAMADIAEHYGVTPAGFGPVGRAWAPRLALAGTYDDNWLVQHWPNPPQDFDYGYWNAAPQDQQLPFLPPDARVELENLIDPQLSQTGTAWFDLPGHRPFLLLRLANGSLLPVPMLTDTVIVDTDAMTVSLTHRMSLPAGVQLRALELRFETDPTAALLRRAETA